MQNLATQYLATKTAAPFGLPGGGATGRIRSFIPPKLPALPAAAAPVKPWAAKPTETPPPLSPDMQIKSDWRAQDKAENAAAAAASAARDRKQFWGNAGLQAGMTVLPMLASSVMQRQHEKQFHNQQPQQQMASV